MKYSGTLIVVKDMDKAKEFYEKVMEQKIVMDIGMHVSFENGLSLQTNYEELVGVKLETVSKSDNFQLYFEVGDIEAWEGKIKAVSGIEFLHPIKEYPWGQRVMRFYDLDKYIVEVAEDMESVARRFQKQGLTVAEIAERMMSPVEFVEQIL